MSNLLDKSSIVLTPTAYDNEKVLCVKPSDGSGDFDFSRNSAATRVNAQGLVEDVQIISGNKVLNGDFSQLGSEEITNGNFSQQGSELVTNGDFATDSDWNKVNSTISGGKGNLDSLGGTSLLFQSALVVGKNYKATLDVSNYNGLGTCALINSNGSVQFEITSNGNKEFYFTHGGTSTNLSFRAISGGAFSIDNVSVVEVGQNWDITQSGNDTILIENQYALFDCPDNSNIFITQSSVLTIGKTYKATFDVLSIDNGGFQFAQGGGGTISGSPTINTIGTHTFTFVAATATFGIKRALGAPNLLNGKITNISVKEVGQNWTIENTWTIGDGVANGNGASGSGEELKQSGVLISGRTYSATYEVKNYVSGTVRTERPLGSIRSANGVYTEILTAQTLIKFRGNNFNGSITNVVFKEITNDTNLPRINYDGFSFDGSGNIIPDSGCGSWLFEPQSTNLIPYSEDFSQWSLISGGSRVSNSVISPDGTQNASSWITDSTGQKLQKNTSGFTQGNEYTFSIYIKADTNLNVGIGGVDSPVVSVAVTTDWQRFEVKQDAAGTTRFPQLQNIGDNGTFYIWGAQAEEDYATSYIPTDGSQKTRNQDVCTNGGSLASINSSEGVLYFETKTLVNGETNSNITLSDGTNDNLIMLRFGITPNRVTAFSRGLGGTYTLNTVNGLPQTDNHKIALVWDASNFKIWVNGTERSTTAINSIPSGMNSLNFTSSSGSDFFFGKTKAVAVWKEPLTDTELAELTTI